ncbi:hypothetical protein ACA910_013466 [Epithemia clementina (nom. ined.)]
MILTSVLQCRWLVWVMLMGMARSSLGAEQIQGLEDSDDEIQQRRRRRRRLDAEWYTRYSRYPDYCATPEQMANRSIPALPENSKAGDTRLLQVTAVIRHGARTPWNAPKSAASADDTTATQCWADYNHVWDCDLTTWIGAPSREYSNGQEGGVGMFWMDKEYTALKDPNNNLSNLWGGTCQRGQLIMQGYDQELQNGKFLRDAYVYQGDGDYGHDRRLRLLDATTVLRDDATLQANVYYRSDDEQRTLMSGQLVLRGMLQDELDRYYKSATTRHHPVMSLHVADRERDILDANLAICPRLKEIQDRFHKSQEYQAFLESPEVQLLNAFKENVLGGGAGDIDCLMTTICTDRELPAAVDDYEGEEIGSSNLFLSQSSTTGGDRENPYGDHLFQRLAEVSAAPVNLMYLANNAEFSKVAMGPLWSEILHHIKAASRGETVGNPTPAKLSLFSGHDSTLIPLLASLGVWKLTDWWPSYASMMLIEVHELNFGGNTDSSVYPTNYAFRLLYNGQVWTSRMEGCPAEPEQFCDLDVLLKLTEPMADRDCNLQHPEPAAYNDHVKQAQDVLKTQGGQWAVGLVAIASFLAGMLVTVAFVSCCCSSTRSSSLMSEQRRRRLVPDGGDEEDGTTEEDGIVMASRATGYRDNIEIEEDEDGAGVALADKNGALT